MNRSAPNGGYDFGNKRDYRRKIYSLFHLIKNRKYAHLLILPSLEGMEIPLAISKGFATSNIHAVDADSNVINTSLWHSKYPEINTYAMSLSNACMQIKQKGVKISAANIDLCGCAGSNKTKESLYSVASMGILNPSRFIIGLNMLRGRESIGAKYNLEREEKDYQGFWEPYLTPSIKDVWSTNSQCADNDVRRLAWAISIIEAGLLNFCKTSCEYKNVVLSVIRSGSYKSSNNQTLVWEVLCGSFVGQCNCYPKCESQLTHMANYRLQLANSLHLPQNKYEFVYKSRNEYGKLNCIQQVFSNEHPDLERLKIDGALKCSQN